MDPLTLGGTTPQTQDPEQGLLGILQQMQALQNQPIVPQDKYGLGAAAAGLSGLSAGIRGTTNPVIEQMTRQRLVQQQGLQEQASVTKSLAEISSQKMAREAQLVQLQRQMRETELHELKIHSEIAMPLVKSEDALKRVFGGRMLAQAMVKAGLRVPEGGIEALSSQPFNAKEIEDALKLVMMGVPKEIVAARKNLDPKMLDSATAMLQNDDARKILGLKSMAEIQLDGVTLAGKTLDNIRKTKENAIPTDMPKDVIPFAVKLFGKLPEELTTLEWREASKAFIDQDLAKAMAAASAQPVSDATLQSLNAISTGRQNLQQLGALLRESPKDVKDYVGRLESLFGWKEYAQKAAPGVFGQVPDKVVLMGFVEDQARNVILAARSGQAVTSSEEGRFNKETPNRFQDDWNTYVLKTAHMARVAQQIERRLRILAGPGGRAALLNEMVDNPLPPLELPDKKHNLPPGFDVVPGQR